LQHTDCKTLANQEILRIKASNWLPLPVTWNSLSNSRTRFMVMEERFLPVNMAISEGVKYILGGNVPVPDVTLEWTTKNRTD